jgi:hypothetical protein
MTMWPHLNITMSLLTAIANQAWIMKIIVTYQWTWYHNSIYIYRANHCLSLLNLWKVRVWLLHMTRCTKIYIFVAEIFLKLVLNTPQYRLSCIVFHKLKFFDKFYGNRYIAIKKLYYLGHVSFSVNIYLLTKWWQSSTLYYYRRVVGA